MTTVIHEQRETDLAGARVDGDALWLTPDDTERATGWALKPEGLCRGPICIPLTPSRRAELTAAGEVDVAGLWRYLGHPVARDFSRPVLGAWHRRRQPRVEPAIA